MMSKIKENKILTIASIFALVGIITIAYAAFTGNLNTSGTGINRKSNYDIYFNNVSNFLTTGTASVTDSTPINQSHTTVIEDYDATLTSLTLGPVKCSVNGDETDTSAVDVCSNIEYTMKYTDSNNNISVNDTLASKETKSVKVTLTYKDFSDASKLPSSNVSISNLVIDMVYTADSEAKTNSDGSTPYDPYPIGREITIQNENYNVIGQGEDYVTLLKQQPLTTSELNAYGAGHLNMYNAYSLSDSWYQQAYDITNWDDESEEDKSTGYGGMAYYTSETCGYVNNSLITSGCTTDYNSSDVKYVVDAWAAAKFTNELKTVDGYSARLVQKEELRTQFYPSCSLTAGWCSPESATPSWLYNSNYSYWYWTMSQYKDFSTNVWSVNINILILYPKRVYENYDGAVRPVINVYKSAIESN